MSLCRELCLCSHLEEKERNGMMLFMRESLSFVSLVALLVTQKLNAPRQLPVMKMVACHTSVAKGEANCRGPI